MATAKQRLAKTRKLDEAKSSPVSNGRVMIRSCWYAHTTCDSPRPPTHTESRTACAASSERRSKPQKTVGLVSYSRLRSPSHRPQHRGRVPSVVSVSVAVAAPARRPRTNRSTSREQRPPWAS